MAHQQPGSVPVKPLACSYEGFGTLLRRTGRKTMSAKVTAVARETQSRVAIAQQNNPKVIPSARYGKALVAKIFSARPIATENA
jgi:hypothetical protein